jgi:hypothetical protein
VRDRYVVLLDALLELVRQAVPVDEEAASAGPFRDEVGVGQPLRVLDALDDHANSITLRMPACASINSTPRFTLSSVMRCETNEATSISPATRLDELGHLVAAFHAAERRAGDAAAGDESAARCRESHL